MCNGGFLSVIDAKSTCFDARLAKKIFFSVELKLKILGEKKSIFFSFFALSSLLRLTKALVGSNHCLT